PAMSLASDLMATDRFSVDDITSLQEEWHAAGLCVPVEKGELFYVQIGARQGAVRVACKTFADALKEIFPGYQTENSQERESNTSVYCWETHNPPGYGIKADGEPVRWFRLLDHAILEAAFLLSDAACKESERLCVLHAAGIERDGRVIILPAVAGSGKTTLTASLPFYGYRILNDDILPVNLDYTLSTLDFPAAIKRGSWHLLSEMYPELSRLRTLTRINEVELKYLPIAAQNRVATTECLAPDVIVQPRFMPEIEPALHPCSPTEAVASIIGASPWFEHPVQVDRVFQVSGWLEKIPAWKINYRSTEEAVAMLDQVLEMLN
ncbi:MAG: hypothetical protein ACPGYX_11555, partial [Oceanobacter sp.]